MLDSWWTLLIIGGKADSLAHVRKKKEIYFCVRRRGCGPAAQTQDLLRTPSISPFFCAFWDINLVSNAVFKSIAQFAHFEKMWMGNV